MADNFDLLACIKQKFDSNSFYSSLLSIVIKTAQFLHKFERQFDIFLTIDSHFPRISNIDKQFINFCMMYVFLLVSKEVVAHVFELIWIEFMLSMHVDKQIDLDSAFDVYVLI